MQGKKSNYAASFAARNIQSTLITDACADELNLPESKTSLLDVLVNQSLLEPNTPRASKLKLQLVPLLRAKRSYYLKSGSFTKPALLRYPMLSNFTMAVSSFNRPSESDPITGVVILESLFMNKSVALTNKYFVKETIFGWVLSGVPLQYQNNLVSTHTQIMPTNNLLKRFWEIFGKRN